MGGERTDAEVAFSRQPAPIQRTVKQSLTVGTCWLVSLTGPQARLESLEGEKEVVQKEYEEVEARDSMLKFQLSEVQQVFEELESQMQDMKLANENLVYPEMQKLRDRMLGLERDLRRTQEDMDKENQIKRKLLKAEEELNAEVRRG